MKVDGLGVVLAVILMPIILVVTYYIQLEVDTIAKENSYNTKLLDATYDAMSAFEINTANEDLSSVADSMRSIILASNNIFLNTLATNFGVSNSSKEYLQPYIPAVLYTMYDGFYIYAPTEIPRVAKKTKTVEDSGELISTQGYYSVGDEPTGSVSKDKNDTYGDVLYEIDNNKDGVPESYTTKLKDATKDADYVLKSYIQYCARYKKDNPNIDVTINYTLDNYLNIEGKIGDVYYTKTGYLIKNDLVSEIKTYDESNSQTFYDPRKTNEDDIKNKILGLKTNAEETTIKAARKVSVAVKGQTISAILPNINNYELTTISEIEEWLDKNQNNAQYQNVLCEVQKYKACAYYASSACFSSWVYENLKDLTYDNVVDTAMSEYYNGNQYKSTSGTGKSDLYFDFKDSSVSGKKIFENSIDPESSESNFNTHKMEVIKNSIKYNLNLSMSAYCKMNNSYEFSLPVLLDEEWDKILSNISIVSFMQGLDCGLDIYNNYQIVSSTNNELTVTPSEIYYVKKEDFNNNSGNYHRIDCPYLAESGDYISFKSKEVKYDKVYDKTAVTGSQYKYDHKNLACYTCINTNNYKGLMDLSKNSYYERIASLKKKNDSTLNDEKKQIAAYIGLAKERQDTYKTNALHASEGYEVVMNSDKIINNTDNVSVSGLTEGKIKELQITIADTKSKNLLSNISREPILKLGINVGGQSFEISLNLDQKKEQTIKLDVSSSLTPINNIYFNKYAPTNYDVEYTIKSIKVIYK